ncbi:MAG TPA: AAA family ATPase [Candidatus Aphodousia faecipullorum]|nr:AAA family ATPase [Candidatus Aphodousia faecipullorum]
MATQETFFVRPRRFGKSLLISTYESLFKHGLILKNSGMTRLIKWFA